MKHRILFVCCVMLWASMTQINAQKGSGNQSSGRLSFYVDYAAFKMFNQKNVTYTQLYFYMSRNQFNFVKKDTSYSAAYTVSLEFTDLNDSKNVVQSTWTTVMDDRIAEADTGKEVPLLFEYPLLLKPSKYILKATIQDKNDASRSGSYTESVEINDFDKSDLMISQIQFATQALKGGNSGEMFVKNGYTVYPNPTRFYGSNLPRLSFYSEVYNLKHTPDDATTNTYTAEFIVTDENGSIIKEYPSRQINKAGETSLLMHNVNVISLPSGRYVFMVRITDNASKSVAISKKLFVVYREGESIYETQADDSFFKDLDEAGAIRAGNIVSLIGREDEKKIFSQLEFEGKKKFLDRFWKDRDPSPGTKSNEKLMDYYKRYEEANMKFTTPNVQGWKTDMGRVMVVYGFPAQIEKHEFESDMKPYQIWYFLQLKDQPAQAIFVFADTDESGTLRLIHSNARGEIASPNWQTMIKK